MTLRKMTVCEVLTFASLIACEIPLTKTKLNARFSDLTSLFSSVDHLNRLSLWFPLSSKLTLLTGVNIYFFHILATHRLDIARWYVSRHAGHCWRSKDELISDVLLWTPTYGCARVGRPARTYIQQLCEDTGCNPEDLPEAMNDREKWRERVKDIRAGGAT